MARLTAALIDWLIIATPILILAGSVLEADSIGRILDRLLILVITACTLPLIYQVIQAYLLTVTGATLGKLVCGLRVVRDDGKFLTAGLSLFRTFVGPVISGALMNLGYIWILIDPERRSWHDMAVGSRVTAESANRFVIGVILIAGLVTVNISLLGGTFVQAGRNLPLYRQIGEEIRDNLAEPTPTVTPVPLPFDPADDTLMQPPV